MISDLDERAWWIFQLPEAVTAVPANTEADARETLVKYCYPNAPVHEWPLIGTRWTSRAAFGRRSRDSTNSSRSAS